MTDEIKTVWVVFDPLVEEIKSVHKTEKGSDDRCFELNRKHNRLDGYYLYENNEFLLEG